MTVCEKTELPEDMCAHCKGIPDDPPDRDDHAHMSWSSHSLCTHPTTPQARSLCRKSKRREAVFQSVCPICREDIQVGDYILPRFSGASAWVHADCLEDDDQ